MIHSLKILPEYFTQVCSRAKSAEFRKNDREFKAGDFLHLKEWNEKEFTGRECVAKITHVSTLEAYIKENYVMLSIQVMK